MIGLKSNLAYGRDADGTVAEEAAAIVLALPEAKDNCTLPSLVSYLAYEARMVDSLPFMFLREGANDTENDQGLLEHVRCLAVAGRILVARVRWLDEMIDGREPLGPPSEVHRLSRAVYAKALDYFASSLSGEHDAADFFRLLAGLEARYATSLAIDAASCDLPSGGRAPASVDLESYAEQAKARAMLASASVEAQMIVTMASEKKKQCARNCLESLAVAWQLGDDVLDLDEDYRDGRFSWIVSETLRNIPEKDRALGSNAFYEVALLGGHVQAALEHSLAFYREAERAAGDLFPAAKSCVRCEIRKTTELLAELTTIVSL